MTGNLSLLHARLFTCLDTSLTRPFCSSESAFKALALAIKEAVSKTGLDDVPSTKGSSIGCK